ncbi:hypothetical protein STAQ_12240 [Allostella sp. ATCC 35155]|nr:hypothetical protein STAQ_12240 [Stella sp. ATCC 35155]
MKKSPLLVGVFLAMILAVSNLAATSAPARAMEGYISGKAINSAAGHRFVTERFGAMKLTRVTVDGRQNDRCNVHVASVREILAKAVASKSLRYSRAPGNGKGILVEVRLRSTSCGSELCCKGSGEGCTATVSVPDGDQVLAALR